VRPADAAGRPLGPAAARVLSALRGHARSRWRGLWPRRRDSAEVIGEALLQGPGRMGIRTLARRLGRPPGAVHGWLRVARPPRGSRCAARVCGGRTVLDPELGAIQPAGSALGDTVEALLDRAWAGCCASAEAVRGRWELAVWLTDGLCTVSVATRHSCSPSCWGRTTSSPSSCAGRLRVKRRRSIVCFAVRR